MITGFGQKVGNGYFFELLQRKMLWILVYSWSEVKELTRMCLNESRKWSHLTVNHHWVLWLQDLTRRIESATSLVSCQRRMSSVLMYSWSDIRELTNMCQSEGKPLDSWPLYGFWDWRIWPDGWNRLLLWFLGKGKCFEFWCIHCQTSENLPRCVKVKASHLTVDQSLQLYDCRI